MSRYGFERSAARWIRAYSLVSPIARLAALAAGDADALVIAKLDRLSRSLLDFSELPERLRREGWQLIALDLGVDTSTPMFGREMRQ